MYFSDVRSAFLTKTDELLHIGDEVVVRGMKTKELLHQQIIILNPLRRIYPMQFRNDNIFAKVAETIWTIAGRNDIEWLSNYLPRAKEFSDDGYTWRGAYGPRLRNWNDLKSGDQIRNCIELLRRDPSSRQAVMSLWNPITDMLPTKDVPCNNWLHFIIRDGKLHLSIAQRSSDIWWGYTGIDMFLWSTLLQMMAFWTDTEVGYISHNITSLHIYERHWEAAQKMVRKYWTDVDSMYTRSDNIIIPEFNTLAGDIDSKLHILSDLNFIMAGTYTHFTNLLDVFGDMLFLWELLKSSEYAQVGVKIVAILIGMPLTDFKIAAIEYCLRTIKNNSTVEAIRDAFTAEIATFIEYSPGDV